MAATLVLVLAVGGGVAWKMGYLSSKHSAPPLTGLTLKLASSLVKNDGLTLSVTGNVYSATVPANDVVSQSPTAGTSMSGGATISITVSKGPAPAAVTLLVHEANQGGPFVVWDYSGSYVGPVANQFNDQISNFWSALAWGYEASGTPVPWGHFPYSFEAWAYVETSATSSLCQVLHKQTIRIVTSDPQLRKSLLASCRAYRLHQSRDPVVVVPAPTKVNNPLTWG